MSRVHGIGLEPPTNLESVDVRQLDVEHDQIGSGGRHPDPLGPRAASTTM